MTRRNRPASASSSTPNGATRSTFRPISPLPCPPVTRRERVARRRDRILSDHDGRLRAFIDCVPAQYVKEGVGELDCAKLRPLPELKYGGADKIRDAFIGFQRHLYYCRNQAQRRIERRPPSRLKATIRLNVCRPGSTSSLLPTFATSSHFQAGWQPGCTVSISMASMSSLAIRAAPVYHVRVWSVRRAMRSRPQPNSKIVPCGIPAFGDFAPEGGVLAAPDLLSYTNAGQSGKSQCNQIMRSSTIP